VKFLLKGIINYDIGSCHNAREVRFSKGIEVPDLKSAVEKAKEIIKVLHGQYGSYTDYALNAELSLAGILWWKINRK